MFKPFKKRFNSEKTILEHELKVNATTYLEVDEGLIPRGEPKSVEDGVHDFRDFRRIQNDSSRTSKLDHNFCLSLKPQEIRPVAWLKSKAVCLQINTTEPGLQVLMDMAWTWTFPLQEQMEVFWELMRG